jgi:HlyD family secretion protein
VTASGQVMPQSKVDLSADITGRITRLAVKDGDLVKEGQFLLQIDPQQYEAQVQRAEAALANSRASLAQSRANLLQAQRNLERLEGIRRTNAALVSGQELEQAQTQLEVNRALASDLGVGVAQISAALRPPGGGKSLRSSLRLLSSSRRVCRSSPSRSRCRRSLADHCQALAS